MNLLLTGAWRDAKKFIPLLEENGHKVVFMQYEQDELPCEPAWVEGAVCNGLFLSHSAEAFSSLSYVQLTSAGFDRVPLEYFHKRGITVNNARGVYSVPMAEHAVAAVLDIYRHAGSFYENRSKHIWQKDRGLRELCGSRVCVIGCGSVGAECAKRFAAMGCEVVGVDINVFENEFFSRIFPIGDIYNVISGTDVVILTLPLTDETRGLADERFFAALKDGCVIVNIARGALIRTEALLKALGERELYAALDVFETEPLDPDDPLWAEPNVMITPHNSFVSDKTADRLNEKILAGLGIDTRGRS